MSSVAVQLQLPRPPMELDESYIASRKNVLHAFVSSAGLGGLEDKQAAAAAGMDAATWSRFKQGDVGIKPLNMTIFCEQTGNDLALARWAYERGYCLTVRESELEKRLRQKEEELERERAENRLLRDVLQRKA